MQDAVQKVFVKDRLIDYLVALIGRTRTHSLVLRGASPRATLAVTSMAKAAAYMNGRDYVLPQDVKTVFVGTVAHRLLLKADAQNQGVTETQLLTDLFDRVPTPGV